MSPLALSLRLLQAQPDTRLVALAREGNEPAFEALVRRYRRELLSYCRRLQPTSESAEDALQQALLQAWRALRAGAEVREVRPWLYRIAHNVAVSSLRIAPPAPHELEDADGRGPEVHELVEQRLQARAALAGMASLPTLQRQVLMSTSLDGASHDEVATALGLSSGAVRGLIYRARATVRAAAAAIMPSPAVSWALRRAETRSGGTSIAPEALAGGGAGAAGLGLIVKGGAVITLAGAVAAGGGVILSHGSRHHGHVRAPLVQGVAAGRAATAPPEIEAGALAGGAAADGRTAAGTNRAASREQARSAGARTHDKGSRSDGHSGSGRGTDGGSSGSGDGGTDGGSSSGATVASVGSGSSGSSDGGSSSGSSNGGSSSGGSGRGGGSSSDGDLSTASTSGSDGGSGGGSSGSSTTQTSTSDGGSGSDGSGSGDTTTTTNN